MSGSTGRPQPARFTAADADAAFDAWGANCGPGALAIMLGLTLDEVRPHMGDFESKGYTNPTLMYAALDSLGEPYLKVRKRRGEPECDWPGYGLVRVQWHGPWMAPEVPGRARYRYTHWIGTALIGGERGVCDINCINNGAGWVTLADWERVIVPHLTTEIPRADGGWSRAGAIELGWAMPRAHTPTEPETGDERDG